MEKLETSLKEIILLVICADASWDEAFLVKLLCCEAWKEAVVCARSGSKAMTQLPIFLFSFWLSLFGLTAFQHYPLILSTFLDNILWFFLFSEFPRQGNIHFLSFFLSSCVEIWFIHSWTCKEASSCLGRKVKTRRTRTARSSRSPWEQRRKRRKWHPWTTRKRWVSWRKRYGQKHS